MAATLGYQAGVEANQTLLSYAPETTWGVKPGGKWNTIRYTSDTLALTKTRQRPGEINITREVSQAVTTEQTAGGTINYALSWGTYDDFFGSLCQGEWSHTPPFQIFSILTDLTIASNGTGTLTLTSTLAAKFATILVGQYVRLSGWVNNNYNTWFRVTVNTGTSLTLVGIPVATTTETSLTSNQVQISGSSLANGTTFHSLFLQRKFDGKGFLRYGGCYVTRITLGANVGSFFTGAIDVVAQSEAFNAADGSTGGLNPAPAGTVVDPVAGYVRMTYNGTTNTIAGNLDQLQITLENTGAAPEFTLGPSAGAAGAAGASGILGGTFQGSGSFRMYCKDFLLYNVFQAETAGDVQFYLQDAARQSYCLSFQNVVFLAKINATGPGAALMVDVTFECNPDTVNGGTFQLNRFPAPN
jgi:Phage tail tube protein